MVFTLPGGCGNVHVATCSVITAVVVSWTLDVVFYLEVLSRGGGVCRAGFLVTFFMELLNYQLKSRILSW